MKKYFSDVIFLLGEDKNKLPKLIIAFIFVSVFDLLGIGIVGPFLGIVFSGENVFVASLFNFLGLSNFSQNQIITVFAVLIFIIFLFKAIAGGIVSFYVIKFSQNQQVRLRFNLITAFQKQTYSDVIKTNSANYVNSIQLMVPNFANLVMHCLQVIGDLIVSLMIILLLLFIYPLAFLILSLLGLFVLVTFDYFVRKKMLVAGETSNRSSAFIIRYLNEAIRGFKDIKILKGEEYFKQRINKSAESFATAQTQINFFSLLPKYIFELIIVSFILLIATLSSNMQDDPVNLIPLLGIFGMAAIRLLPMARNLTFTLNRIRYTKDSVENLIMMLNSSKLENIDKIEPRFSFKTLNSISLKKISFMYSNAKTQSLKNITFKINFGEHIGIVGASGAGKTTLVNILLGLHQPSSGRIFLNDKDISDMPSVLWEHVAYLPQEIFLIDATIKQNIALAQDENQINLNKMNEAIKQARLNTFVESLPNKVNTFIGENGISISGGQRQRIALARAFYFDKKIIVLDEATSSLDEETENQIIEYLKFLRKQVTVISITHRKKTLIHCDRIFNISNGKLNEIVR